MNFALPVAENTVNEIKNFSLSPNPATSTARLTIELPVNTIATIKLMNVLGEELLTNTMRITTPVEIMNLDLSHIENGFYLVVLEAGNQHKMQKLTISK